jgi:putative heme degradation protein
MTDAADRAKRVRLSAPAAAVLKTLSAMGNVMVTIRYGGATHERMGPVESVQERGNWARVVGDSHTAQIDLAICANCIADRSIKMGDRYYPRLEFLDQSEDALLSAIALDGLEAFDTAIASIADGTVLEPADRPPLRQEAEVSASDPGMRLFEAVGLIGDPITIEIRRTGLVQNWRGAPPAPKAAMGFINLMLPDFHLHLRAGAITGWRMNEAERSFDGLSPAGEPVGLTVRAGHLQTLSKIAREMEA